MKEQAIERAISKIMRICKGYRAKEMAEDRAEYPEAHDHERSRIRTIIRNLKTSKSVKETAK